MSEYHIFSDGSARNNPGRGGYGTIVREVKDDKILSVKEFAEGFESTTNNRMELLGVITGLEYLPNEKQKVTVTSDSIYVVNAFNKGWLQTWILRGWIKPDNKPVKNVDLWERLSKLTEKHDVTFKWVKGHAEHPENERCDFLATSAADGLKMTYKDDGTLEVEVPEDAT